MSHLKLSVRMAVLALAGVLSGHATASEFETEVLARCEAQAGVAERIMRHRQVTNDLESTWRMAWLIRNLELSQVAQRLVSEAYRHPRQANDEDRKRVASEFAAEARTACQASTH